jgi:hypothetical protein
MSTRRWLDAGAIALALLVAVVNFAVGVGDLSYFGDEVFSIDVAREPLGDVLDHTRATEIAPPAYYYALHLWISVTGAEEELGLRLPSLLAAVLLVVAVYGLARSVAGRAASALAAALVALSPLVLTYAQQVRAYSLALLLVTAAAALAIVGTAGGARGRAARAACVALCVAALWTHYTTALVVAPLLAWIAVTGWRQHSRGVAIGCVGVAALALVPLAQDQLSRGSEEHPSAALSARNAIDVLATPFDGRDITVLGLGIAAAALVVVALVHLAMGIASSGDRGPRLLVLACAVVPLAVVGLLAIGGQDIAWSRYTAVAAPFVIVCIAVLVDALRGPLALAVAALAVALAVVGAVRAHGRAGEYPATREVVMAAADGWRAGDVFVLTLNGTVNQSLTHYTGRALPPRATVVPPLPAAIEQAVNDGNRLWLVSPEVSAREIAAGLGGRFAICGVERFAAAAPLQLTLAAPTRTGSAGSSTACGTGR